MKLIIIPGASDPFDFNNKCAYSLLRDEAMKRKFDECIILNYHGHYSFDNNSSLNIESTYKLIKIVVNKCEEHKKPYIVYCRCFGCLPFIELLKSNEFKPVFLKKVILWGAQPYVDLFEILKASFDERSFRSKKVRINGELFQEIFPFELSIEKIDKDINYQLVITSGELDNYYSEYFHKSLKAKNKNKNIDFHNRIKGVGHSVTKPNDEYFKLIFG